MVWEWTASDAGPGLVGSSTLSCHTRPCALCVGGVAELGWLTLQV